MPAGGFCALYILLLLARHSASLDDSPALNNLPAASPEGTPLVMVTILARNSAHTLPNFFGYLEGLDYPKNRISIWIRTDHNEDDTQNMLSEWAENMRDIYWSVDLKHEKKWLYPSRDPFVMSEERYLRMVHLRQEGLEEARRIGAQYLLWLDCDNFIVNNQTLQLLMEQKKPIIAPVLESARGQAYSNFWSGQNENGYYKRVPEYLPILKRNNTGCFSAVVVYGTVLIDLQIPESQKLAFWPQAEDFNGPQDDVIQFAYSAKKRGLGIYVLNTHKFGYIIRTENYVDLNAAVVYFFNFKMQTLVNHPPVAYSRHISRRIIPRDKQGLDKIFMINLERRPERRNRMLACLDELKLDFTLFNAVDGRKLNQTYLDELGIKYLPGWKDPWGERPMTFGEVGCFLSHYFIWKQMLDKNLEEVLILEDDVDFEPNFRHNLQIVLNEAHNLTPSWDLIYVGRKILDWESEKLVPGATQLSVPHYSYWTLGYLISLRGARKLIEANPLNKLLPVDEYLPIMFNAHPETDWAAHFSERNLNVYSAHPLLVNPTHYVGDKEWFSDTEPPLEILEKIRERKRKQEQEEEEREKMTKNKQKSEEELRQERVREQAMKRQVETMRARLKPKSEL